MIRSGTTRNVFHETRRLAEEREGTPGAGYLVRIHFENLLDLAEAGSPLEKAVAGSVPPEMRQLWNRMENRGVQVTLSKPPTGCANR